MSKIGYRDNTIKISIFLFLFCVSLFVMLISSVNAQTGLTVEMKFYVTYEDEPVNDASIKVVKSLPQFRPGNQNGKRVSVWYSIPVSFRLN